MSVDISFILPSIRLGGVLQLLDSIPDAVGDYTYEVIIGTPSDQILDINLLNVKAVKTFASPNMALQLALLEATGEYICWTTDDSALHPNVLKEGIDNLKKEKEKTVYVYKYTESDNPSPDMWTDWYYQMSCYPGTCADHIPKDWYCVNYALMKTAYLKELGGFDCQFEIMVMGLMDLAVRLQRDGANVILKDEMIAHVGHMAGTSGDHSPVCLTQIHHDEPLFKQIYNNVESLTRIKIPLDTYKSQPEKWSRRFAS